MRPLQLIKDLTFIPIKVIKGWDIGVSTMKVGEVATLFIKSHYGYGSAGSPPKVFQCLLSTLRDLDCFFSDSRRCNAGLWDWAFWLSWGGHHKGVALLPVTCACTWNLGHIYSPQDKDMGVVKRTKTAGEGYDQPNDGSQVKTWHV